MRPIRETTAKLRFCVKWDTLYFRPKNIGKISIYLQNIPSNRYINLYKNSTRKFIPR